MGNTNRRYNVRTEKRTYTVSGFQSNFLWSKPNSLDLRPSTLSEPYTARAIVCHWRRKKEHKMSDIESRKALTRKNRIAYHSMVKVWCPYFLDTCCMSFSVIPWSKWQSMSFLVNCTEKCPLFIYKQILTTFPMPFQITECSVALSSFQKITVIS